MPRIAYPHLISHTQLTVIVYDTDYQPLQYCVSTILHFSITDCNQQGMTDNSITGDAYGIINIS